MVLTMPIPPAKFLNLHIISTKATAFDDFEVAECS
jgi:hypothetical protein